MQSPSYTPEQLQELLSALTCPDTMKIKQATGMLKPYFKCVQALSNLLYLMSFAQEPTIRQLACVYLRKVITTLWV